MSDHDGTNDTTLPVPVVKRRSELLGAVVMAVPQGSFDVHNLDEPESGLKAGASLKQVDDAAELWLEVPDPPGVSGDLSCIWHYTDAAGVVGILGSDTMRGASLASLNDSAEYSYGRQLLAEIHETVQASRNVHPRQKHHLRNMVALADELVSQPGLFVVCASESPDSLSQWRSYGSNMGHALILDPRENLSVLSTSDSEYSIDDVLLTWRQVIYDVKAQTDFLMRVLAFLAYETPSDVATFSGAEEGARSSAMVLVRALAHCKEPSFREEREVRIISRAPDLNDIHFRAGATGVTPYLLFTGAPSFRSRTVSSPNRLPVTGVNVGPFADRAASAKGVETLLSASQYASADVQISPSTLR
jgi:hypothetical protein